MLKNKTALITGGATGIGLSIARYLSENNAQVYICGRRLEKLQEAKRQLPKLNIIQCDISDISQIDKMLNQIKSVDILINNAGVLTQKSLEESDLTIYNRTMDTNFKAPFYLTTKIIPMMKGKKSGSIIQIASTCATKPLKNLSLYSASKAALVAMNISLAKENKNANINICSISPGRVDTPLLQANIGAEESKNTSPDKIAELVLNILTGRYPISPGEDISIGRITFIDRVVKRIQRCF